MPRFLLGCCFFSFITIGSALYRSDKGTDLLSRPFFQDAFSTKLSEITRVKQPTAVLVVNHTVYVSSFLSDSVLQTTLPLSQSTQFRVFAQGSYCTPQIRRCAILNGPWGLAHSMGHLFVSSFGSDQVLVFEASSGRFLDAFGDSGSLDSPEGLALSGDGSILYVTSFLDSRIVAFNLRDVWSRPVEEADDGVSGKSQEKEWRESYAVGPVALGKTLASGLPVDLDYLVSEDDSHVSHPRFGFSPLHGPEGIAVLPSHGAGQERLAVTSYYNSSVLILDAYDGALLEVIQGPPGTLDGPMGIAVDDACSWKQGTDCLLITTYKSRALRRNNTRTGSSQTQDTHPIPEEAEEVTAAAALGGGAVSRFVRRNGWHFDGLALSSPLLRGPSAVAVLPDGSALACAYDGSALLLFNATEAGLERQFVASVAGRLASSPNFISSPFGDPEATLTRPSKKKSRKKRRLQGGSS